MEREGCLEVRVLVSAGQSSGGRGFVVGGLLVLSGSLLEVDVVG